RVLSRRSLEEADARRGSRHAREEHAAGDVAGSGVDHHRTAARARCNCGSSSAAASAPAAGDHHPGHENRHDQTDYDASNVDHGSLLEMCVREGCWVVLVVPGDPARYEARRLGDRTVNTSSYLKYSCARGELTRV